MQKRMPSCKKKDLPMARNDLACNDVAYKELACINLAYINLTCEELAGRAAALALGLFGLWHLSS